MDKSPSPGSNISRKRVAAAAPDRSSEIAVKIEAPSTQPAQDLIVYDAEGESLDDTDGGNDDEEEEDDDDDDDDDDDEGEDEEQVSNRNSLHHEPNSYLLLAEQRLNPHTANVESTGNSRAPATGFCLRDRAGCITLPRSDALPREVFAHDRVCHPWRQHNEPARLRRIVRYDDPSAILVYANALWCAGSQRKKSRAGCAILTRAAQDEYRLAECKGFILEQTGPKDRVLQGDNFLYTQKRADLRAVIAALENQPWALEGWKTVTIATKSAYAYNGMTRSIAKWKSQNWLTGAHPRCPPVTDADLWSHAIGLVNEQAYRGCEVQFWLVPRNQNLQTEDHARWLAKESDLPVPEAYVPFGPRLRLQDRLVTELSFPQ